MSLCNAACDIVKYVMGHKLENTIVKISSIYIYYSFDTGEYHESVGLVFTRVPQA